MQTPPPTSHPASEALRAQRASVAVALAPLLVLLGFTAVIVGLIEPDTGLVLFAACAAWVVFEMVRYQRSLGQAPEDACGPLP